MHSFHHSRGRIFFDFVCVLVVVASCMGAWIQTGASALIGAASAAGLYGLVRLSDMRWSQPAEAIEPQRIACEPDCQDEQPVINEIVVPFSPADLMPSAGEPVAEAQSIELKVARARDSRPAKTPRKSGTRRSGTAKAAKVSEPIEEAKATAPAVADEPHTQVAPLFEPEPFVRMPRQAFGRRGRI